jgi:hypothetical protein
MQNERLQKQIPCFSLVVLGARENSLPEKHITKLQTVEVKKRLEYKQCKKNWKI